MKSALGFLFCVIHGFSRVLYECRSCQSEKEAVSGLHQHVSGVMLHTRHYYAIYFYLFLNLHFLTQGFAVHGISMPYFVDRIYVG